MPAGIGNAAQQLTIIDGAGTMSELVTPNLLTVKQFSKKHQAFSEPSLRWMVYQAGNPDSGIPDISDAIVRVGRRVLLDEAKIFQIIMGC